MMAALPLLLFGVLLFGSAALARSSKVPAKWLNHPAIYALGLLSVFGALGYFGLTEMAGRYGLSGLLGFMAFSVVFLFGPLVMRPLKWAAHTRRLSTLADLFCYRYRGAAIGRLVTTALLLSSLPFAAAQIQTAGYLLQPTPTDANTSAMMLWPAAMFCVLLGLFLAWLGQGNRHQRALRVTLAIGSLVACITLVAVCAMTIWKYFGGLTEFNGWITRQGQNDIVRRVDHAYGLVTLFLAAGLTLPHLYHQQTPFNPLSKSAAVATWLFPLLLFICTLTMFPLLWGGLALRLEVPLQYYLLELSATAPWLNVSVVLGGLLISGGATLLILLSLAKMACRYFADPLAIGQTTLYRRQAKLQQGFLLCWLPLALITSHAIESNSITNLTLVSFIGAAQLAPGILAALYVPILNRRGVAAGLISGMTLWVAGLFIPLFIGEWHWYSTTGRFDLHVGAANWSGWLLASLTVNFGVSLIVSRLTATDADEKHYARACMVDSVSAPQRVEPSQCQLDALQQRLTELLGDCAAQRELRRALTELRISGTALRPFEWRQLREKLLVNLHELIGVVATNRVIDASMPLSNARLSYLQDPRSIESLLADRRQELRGIAAELNKLRLHHQQTLLGLPLGACAVDSNGEILLWNQALEKLTGVPVSVANGSHLSALPAPWNETLTRAADRNTTHHHAVKVHYQGRTVWFNLHKAVVPYGDDPAGEQVILLEDITESLQLTRQVAHTERLASVGRLAAGVAHEIGNPVAGIACLAQDIRNDVKNAEQRQLADLILTQTERITRIVRSMIDFSRAGTDAEIQLHAVSVKETLHQAEQLLSLQKEKHQIAYRIAVPDNLLVRGDPHQLVQVFLNLMGNARDASHTGDSIDIVATDEDETVKIILTDCGSGIAPDKLDKVMEPFYTTKEAGEGTGLGLYLAYSMVRSYGGNIVLHSPVSDGRGTRVTVRLPKAEATP